MTTCGLVIDARTVHAVQQQIQNAQKIVDSEVLRVCEPYVPKKTGSLARSGITGTKIGSGCIRYTAPYARRQYYHGRASQQRGRFWFERAKNAHKSAVLKKAQMGIKK